MDLPEQTRKYDITLDDYALIDELSGFTQHMDQYMKTHEMPETTKDKLRARMYRYKGEKPKEIALNEIRNTLFGDQR